MNPAKPSLRLLAFIIDVFLVLILYSGLFLAIAQSTSIDAFLNAGFIALFVIFIIFTVTIPMVIVILTSLYGGTPGKLLTGLNVVGIDGKRISFKTAFYREIVGKFASGCFLSLGYVWIFKDLKHRGWHDLIAGTLVIRKSDSLPSLGLLALMVSIAINMYIIILAWNGIQNNMPFYQNSFDDVKRFLEAETETGQEEYEDYNETLDIEAPVQQEV